MNANQLIPNKSNPLPHIFQKIGRQIEIIKGAFCFCYAFGSKCVAKYADFFCYDSQITGIFQIYRDKQQLCNKSVYLVSKMTII